MDGTPKTCRELAAYLATHRLVRVSGYPAARGSLRSFVGQILLITDTGLWIQPVSGRKPQLISMPTRWTVDQHDRINSKLTLDVTGFTLEGLGTIRLTYLDERNPFAT